MKKYPSARAVLCAILGVVAILAAVRMLGSDTPAFAQRGIPSTCAPNIAMSTVASTTQACDLVPVTVTFGTMCPVCPGGLNAIFVLLEHSQQPEWQSNQSGGVLDAVERYADENDVAKVNLAVVHYNGQDARTVQQLTDNFERVRAKLRTQNGYIPRGAVVPAANEAVRQLNLARGGSNDQDNPCELVVMFAHIKSHDPNADELRRAGNIIKREVDLFLVGCPIEPGAWYCRVEPEMPRSRQYFAEYSENRLPQVARREIDGWDSQGRVSTVELEQALGPGLQYVDGSASVPPGLMEAIGASTRLSWTWDDVQSPPPPMITYMVKPLQAGAFTMTGSVELTDTIRRSSSSAPEQVTILNVEGECEVATATPTATATASPTQTPVPPTATPRPKPIYIPVVVKEECSDRVARSDVALVVDLSTSMNRLTRDSRTKLRATQDAVHVFVDLMDLGTDEVALNDRVAIVGFNREAWIEVGLVDDPVLVHAAVERLPERQQEFTRLDLAFERGADALLDPETRDPSRKSVLVVLTDGLPNQVPYAEDGSMETTVIRAASAAREAGLEVYTVGVGQPGDVNDELLADCASAADGFYRAEDAEDLAGIYAQIATTVLCPRGRHKWGEPWP